MVVPSSDSGRGGTDHPARVTVGSGSVERTARSAPRESIPALTQRIPSRTGHEHRSPLPSTMPPFCARDRPGASGRFPNSCSARRGGDQGALPIGGLGLPRRGVPIAAVLPAWPRPTRRACPPRRRRSGGVRRSARRGRWRATPAAAAPRPRAPRRAWCRGCGRCAPSAGSVFRQQASGDVERLAVGIDGHRDAGALRRLGGDHVHVGR